MQYWPRGVKKQKIDAWYKELGTEKELIREWKAGNVSWPTFRSRYLASLRDDGKQALVNELAKRAKKGKVTLLCGCRDPNRCHRAILKELIEEV